MPVMADRWIRRMALEHGMIEPFTEAQKRDGVISYGLSSYGYDARAGDEFKIFTNVDSAVVDPKAFNPDSFVDRRGPVATIPPNSFALTHTVEYFRIPRDILVVCLGKSTYARCGIIVNVTPLEPEWEGQERGLAADGGRAADGRAAGADQRAAAGGHPHDDDVASAARDRGGAGGQ